MASLPNILIELPRNPAVAVGLPMALGFTTGFLTKSSSHGPNSAWYKSLRKAKYDPPRWSFGVVWPTLYAAMGWSSHLIVKSLDKTTPGFGRDKAKFALGLYWTQLALNQLWTPLNFGAGYLGLAFVDLLALTGSIGYLIKELQDVEPQASYFLVPYFAWCSYASYLNGSLWWKNGGSDSFKKLLKKAE